MLRQPSRLRAARWAGLAAVTLLLAGAGFAASTFSVAVVSGPSGTVTDDAAVFSYTANDAADFTCSLDDQAELCGESTTGAAKTYTGMTDGEHTFVVEAVERPVIVERGLAGSTASTTTAAATTATATRSWVVSLPSTTTVGPPPPPPPPPGRLETLLLSGPSGTIHRREARFRFRSEPPGARFDCALDDGPFASCSSPAVYVSLASGRHTFRVRAHNRAGVDPSPAARGWRIVGGTGWLGLLGLGALGLLGIGAVVGGVRWGPLRYRRRLWQRRSGTEPPRRPCTVCTRYCRKVELELKPARRRIESLVCSTADGVLAHVEGEPVQALNRAVRRYRKQRPTLELRLTLHPIAEHILGVVGDAAAAQGAVTVDARLKGGEVECRFELYHCEPGVEGPVWTKEDEWKATVGDEREERVAGLTIPLVPTAAFAYLLEDLLTFVTKVDVPPAEAAKALTGP